MTSIDGIRTSGTPEQLLSSQNSIISPIDHQAHDGEQYQEERFQISQNATDQGEEQHGETALDELLSLRKPNIIQDWWWKILGAFFSVECVVAIVAILASAHEQPRSYWGFVISPNALIAIFSTLSKAALLMPVASCISQLKWVHFMKNPNPLADFQVYENASRGPWGSLNLLWATKGKRHMATWGAFITILALGMEPFIQAIIVYPQRQIGFFFVNPTDSKNIGQYLFSILNTTSRSDYGKTLMSSSNLSETIANITQSITYALGVSKSSNEALGTALTNEQYIHVRWTYITFPLFVVAMGIAFLAWTLFYTSLNKSMPWKSSSIVPLLATPDLWAGLSSSAPRPRLICA